MEKLTLTATSGGGMVTATADGKGQIKRIQIDPSVVNAADVEMLEDLVLVAVTEVQKKAARPPRRTRCRSSPAASISRSSCLSDVRDRRAGDRAVAAAGNRAQDRASAHVPSAHASRPSRAAGWRTRSAGSRTGCTAARVCANLTEDDPCDICADTRRDHAVVCVVEEASDIGAIERAGEFRGVYHVLGGRLSPLDGVGPEDLNVDRLVERVTPRQPCAR